MLLDKKDAMEMVGHHLQGKHLYLWIAGGDVMPIVGHLFS